MAYAPVRQPEPIRSSHPISGGGGSGAGAGGVYSPSLAQSVSTTLVAGVAYSASSTPSLGSLVPTQTSNATSP